MLGELLYPGLEISSHYNCCLVWLLSSPHLVLPPFRLKPLQLFHFPLLTATLPCELLYDLLSVFNKLTLHPPPASFCPPVGIPPGQLLNLSLQQGNLRLVLHLPHGQLVVLAGQVGGLLGELSQLGGDVDILPAQHKI